MRRGWGCRGLRVAAVMLFVLVLPISSFAETTKYIYDPVNRMIRLETGGGIATISATASTGGSINPSGVLGVRYGDSQSFTISPNSNYHITDVKVDSNSVGPVTTYTFSNISANHTIEAFFALDTNQLTVSVNDPAAGMVTSSPAGISCGNACSKVFDYGTEVTLTANPATGYYFAGWGGACSGDDTCSITMNSATDVTATFARQSFFITSTPDFYGRGELSPSGTVVAYYGESKTFTIIPNAGYQVSNVLVDGVFVGQVASYTFSNVTSNHTISANFSCPNVPVRIGGANPRYFSSLQAAYDAAADGEVIQAHGITLTESINLNRPISISLEGGYDCSYSSIAGVTYLKGKITVSSGTATIKNFVTVVETTAPTTTASPAGGVYNTAQNVILTCSDGTEGTGCDKTYYTTDGSTPTTSSSMYTGPINIPTSTVLKFFSMDKAGNAEVVKTETYTIDMQGATGQVLINAGAASTNNSSVTLNVTCTDPSGCSQMQFSNDNITWSPSDPYVETRPWILETGDGIKTVYAKFKDTMGNWSNLYTATILLDTTAPVTISSLADGAFNKNKVVTLSCSDLNGSGCDKIYYTLDGTTPTSSSSVYTWAINITETTTIKYYAVDFAGNSESVKTNTYTIDKVGPSGTITINGGAATTNNANVTLTPTCTDPAGCAEMQFSNDNVQWSAAEAFSASKAWTLSPGDELKTVYVKFKDVLGNWSNPYTASILFDTGAPTTTVAPLGGVFATAQLVTLTCNDGTSGAGCDKTYYTTDGSTPTTSSPIYTGPITISATTTLKYFSADQLGNREAAKSQAYAISPIRIAGATTRYISLQAAYDAAVNGDVIQVQAISLVESININRDISVTLDGGYSTDFTSKTGDTALKGMIQTFPGGGTLTLKNFVINY